MHFTQNLLTLNDTINKFISKINKLDLRIRKLLKNDYIANQNETNNFDIINTKNENPEIVTKKPLVNSNNTEFKLPWMAENFDKKDFTNVIKKIILSMGQIKVIDFCNNLRTQYNYSDNEVL